MFFRKVDNPLGKDQTKFLLNQNAANSPQVLARSQKYTLRHKQKFLTLVFFVVTGEKCITK